VAGPSPLPWLAGAALLAMAVVAAGRTRRWSDALVAALALVVALDLVQAAGAWAAAQAPLAGKLLSLGASAAGWVVAGLAIRQLRRHRVESGLFQLLLAAGLRLPGAVDSREHADQPMTDGSGGDDPVENEPVLATVLPWPGGRRLDSFDDLDDPDLPGGA
jgi:hypothetical protein